jgi:hypothetical protein
MTHSGDTNYIVIPDLEKRELLDLCLFCVGESEGMSKYENVEICGLKSFKYGALDKLYFNYGDGLVCTSSLKPLYRYNVHVHSF